MTSEQLSRIAYDPRAFEAFYRDNVEAVQRFIARRVGDPHLAADLTAAVFLAAIDTASSFDPRRGTPSAWLFGVARNVVSAEHRRTHRDKRLQQHIEGRRLLDDDDIERLQERIDAERESRKLVDSISRLPATQRAVLELVAVDDLSVAEAAAALDIRPVTARVRLHRARASLRNQPPTITKSTVTPTTTLEVP